MNPLKDLNAHLKLMQFLRRGRAGKVVRRTSRTKHKPTVKAKSSGRFGRQLVRRWSIRRYIPGTIGLSAVSEAIRRDYGAILSRRERRQLARQGGPAFRPYYNNAR